MLFDTLIGDVGLAYLVLAAAFVTIIDFIYFLKVKEVFRWVKLVYSFAGLYQFIIYGWMLFDFAFRESDESRILARIGGILILSAVGLGTTVRGFYAHIFADIHHKLFKAKKE